MSDNTPELAKPLDDAAGQQAKHAEMLAEREARNKREAEADAARKEADTAADAEADAAEKAAEAKPEPLPQGASGPAPLPELSPEQQAAKVEADKADRAENRMTAAANGDFGAVAYGPRIAAAKFEHRNQGHDDTMQLLDDMLAGIQRLEAKLAGQ